MSEIDHEHGLVCRTYRRWQWVPRLCTLPMPHAGCYRLLWMRFVVQHQTAPDRTFHAACEACFHNKLQAVPLPSKP